MPKDALSHEELFFDASDGIEKEAGVQLDNSSNEKEAGDDVDAGRSYSGCEIESFAPKAATDSPDTRKRRITKLLTAAALEEDKAKRKNEKPVMRRRVESLILQKESESMASYVGAKRTRGICGITTLHPYETFRQRWDIAVGFALLWTLWSIPYNVCFKWFSLESWKPEPLTVIDLCVDALFIVDVCVNFMTGYFDVEIGRYVFSRKLIAKNYLKGWFWIDFPTSIPTGLIFELTALAEESKYNSFASLPRLLRLLRIIRLVKLLRVFKLVSLMSKWEGNSPLWQAVRLAKFFLLIFFSAHIGACFFMLSAVGTADSDGYYDPNSWVVRYREAARRIEPYTSGELYIIAMYWALSTLTTVGYGDVVPYLPGEVATACIVMFAGSCTMGYIIGNVASLIAHEDHINMVIKDKIKVMNSYMKYRGLPDELVKRIKAHYEYTWKRTCVYDENTLLGSLPPSLRSDVALHIHADIIKAVPFLSEMSNECLAELLLRLKYLQIAEGERLLSAGHYGREMYIVRRGELAAVTPDGTILQTMGQASYVAEYQILCDDPQVHPISIDAIVVTELLVITKEDFEDVMSLYPASSTSIYSLKSSLSLDADADPELSIRIQDSIRKNMDTFSRKASEAHAAAMENRSQITSQLGMTPNSESTRKKSKSGGARISNLDSLFREGYRKEHQVATV